ncbi:MAG: Endo-1,4-beta-xylanase A precursor [Firmicutes bacterium ADurb.Bin193]|nr:MAG: Endo-1,4-beta-xylanase A precursor [Firmicutes bacterium ADurb.Bin193]
MLRKALFCATLICISLMTALSVMGAQASFPDLAQDHWAYTAVAALVEDGTVKGFDDGQFKPANTVSRAEFVKMLGMGSDRRTRDFSDVPPSYWGYEYIMTSGLEGEDNKFNPEAAITRGDVLRLIWKRNGSVKGVIAPSIVTAQSADKDPVAWGYTNGIMVGDDGMNLRLGDSLSRAEAAVLIVRARSINENSPKKNFVDTVSSESLKRFFESVRLFDNMQYDENKTITNGEMARAAVRLGSEEYNLTYSKYPTKKPFEHEYSSDLYIIGTNCIGEDKINKEFIDKPANVRDTLVALTYNMIRKSRTAVRYGRTDNYYKDIGPLEKTMENICLTYSFENGVSLYADGSISPDKPVTLKEFTCILLQLDNLIGSESEFTTEFNKTQQIIKNSKIRKDISGYPENYKDFRCILEGIPNEVYTEPFADSNAEKKPVDSYNFSREFGFVFINMLNDLDKSIERDTDVKIAITYYPSLVCDNGNGATIRIKCEILENPSNLSLKDIFKGRFDVENAPPAEKGLVFYGDIVTGQKIEDIHIPLDKVSLKKIVYVQK